MTDTFTPEDKAHAKAQSWCLEYVFDTEKNKWLLCTLPLEIKGDVRHVMTHVTNIAKTRDPVCIKALRLIHQHNLRS